MTPAGKKTFGLVGNPIKHSLSPLMHNAAFAHLKINAEYKLFEIKPEELSNFFLNIEKENISGLNVTIPYKEKVIPFLSLVSDEARLIGAVNTVRVSKGKLEGFNTDGEGFLRHLKEDLSYEPKGKTISLIGAGGAARAVSVFLSRSGPKKLSIYDLDRPKAEALINNLSNNFSDIEFVLAGSISGLNIQDSSLLINATSIGLKDTDPCLVNEGSLHKDLLVYDLIYNPKETKLLKMAKAKGAVVSNGLGMLLYQGIIAFEIWTNRKAPKDIMNEALKKELK